MKKSRRVITGNALIESRYKISLLEMKVFLSAITQIEPEDKNFKTYQIFYSDFMSQAELKGGSMYSDIREACRNLRKYEFIIIEDKGKQTENEYITGFFAGVDIYKYFQYVGVRFDTRLKPYLLQLKKNFTIFDIRNVMLCRSVYSIRIYQLLKQYEKLGKRTFEIGELKDILGLKHSQYAQWINFKTKVIEPARKELKKYSDIYFVYRGNRQGRAFHSLTFTIKRKKLKRSTDTGPAVDSYEDVIAKINAPTAPPYAP